ncbi:alkaline shock response membrane anchor protein AmaP [Cohnella sp. CFH 77786]|uniref:alkaline shock response membrane anchor protein AmaP n=1 Tax=Cohnella sp. CFH 77786 TaxID=2662265 RepID=UPI001C60A4C0|nr:alkaline shock response membrane anchor protein AmaP [Cohnella sp. CFH 77786]MBW5446773.1 alkaline shock response membrane anchor protein AmaP [Cohnella sp. CFH 77786]
MIRMLDRLLLFLYSIAIGAASVIAIVAASGGFSASFLHDFVTEFSGGNRSIQGAVIGAAIVILLVSLRFFIVSVRRGGASTPSINQRTEHGDIRISVETVENLALKAASRTRGVKDLKARVRVTESGLTILIRAFVDGEGSIPALSEEMQRTVSLQIEEATGIPVAEVSVFIANVLGAQATFKSRVE